MAGPDVIVSADQCGDVALPVDPYVSNRYHFGMLLGVADLDTEQAYHRGKAWLHAAWLHGAGAVWGLRVEVRADDGEVVVHPGLAIDEHGRELVVAEPMCVDLRAWFAERRPDDLQIEETPDGGRRFTVHVLLCHDGCLARPVPSISEPCENADFDTAYSRTRERGLPRLAAGPVPALPAPAYPRLRQLAGQADVVDDVVTDALAALSAAAPADRGALYVQWFRALAAEDTMDLAPADGAPLWSPAAGDGCIPLAEIAVHLAVDGERVLVVDDGDAPTTVDNRVRPAHVRTRTIQELCCPSHATAGGIDDDGGGGGEPEHGPVAQPDDAVAQGDTIRVPFDAPLDERTVTPEAAAVTTLGDDGWVVVDVEAAAVDDGSDAMVLTVADADLRPLRIVVAGTGPEPVLGADGRPVAGAAGAPPDPTGRDAAVMLPDDSEDDE